MSKFLKSIKLFEFLVGLIEVTKNVGNQLTFFSISTLFIFSTQNEDLWRRMFTHTHIQIRIHITTLNNSRHA